MRMTPIWLAAAMLLCAGQSQALEDPTRPPAYSAGTFTPVEQDSEPTWVLSSTLISRERRLAVINGQTVRNGDMVGEARVIGIAPDHVRMQRGAEVFTLKLLSTPVKKPRSTQSGGRP